MKEIKRIINPFVNAICSYHINDQEFCENLRKDEVELTKAIEQHVIKAIEESSTLTQPEQMEYIRKAVSNE